jgi:hypothetical protein
VNTGVATAGATGVGFTTTTGVQAGGSGFPAGAQGFQTTGAQGFPAGGLGAPVNGGNGGLGLSDTQPGYNPDIAQFILSRCGQCHMPGQAQPPLDNYLNTRNAALAIIPAIETDQGVQAHATLVTSTAERQRFRNWVQLGAPEYAPGVQPTGATAFSTTGAGLPTGVTTTGAGFATTGLPASSVPYDPCNPQATGQPGGVGFPTTTGFPGGVGLPTTTGLPGDPNGDGWNELINPPLLAQCHSQGFVYDRSLERCHKARLATTYSCDRNGIVGKFMAVNVNIATNFDQLIAQGYQIDQCGEFNNEPVVLFYMQSNANNQLTLLFKKFCKQGSAACTNP